MSSATARARCATVTAVSEAQELPELSFVRPLPGFGDLRRFVLVELTAAESAEPVLFELRSLEEPAVRFLAAVPTAFFPDYAFDLDADDCAAPRCRAARSRRGRRARRRGRRRR